MPRDWPCLLGQQYEALGGPTAFGSDCKSHWVGCDRGNPLRMVELPGRGPRRPHHLQCPLAAARPSVRPALQSKSRGSAPRLALTGVICIKDTRKVARDNTVKYHRRVLQLLPGVERPSYAGLRVDALERAHGELMIGYQGEAVDYQEGRRRPQRCGAQPAPAPPVRNCRGR